MKRLLPVLLTLAVLLGSAGVSWSADFVKGLRAYEMRDYATALRELKPLAEQGDARAQKILGEIHEYGNGVLKDYKIALKWYRLAAEQGNSDAQNLLGRMYHNGNAVLKDYILAHMWFNIAASTGKMLLGTFFKNKVASSNRDDLEKRMSPSQIAEAQKLARECVKKNYKGC